MIRAVAASALALAACGSLDQFEIPLSQTGAFRGSLDSIPGAGIPRWPAGGSVSQEIENQGVEAGDITSARLKSGSITVTSPSDGDLSFLGSLEIFVSAPGLEEKRIAHQDADFANRKQAYTLVLDDVELKPYVTASSMELKPVVKQTKQPMKTTEVKLDLVLFVDLSAIE